MVASLVLGVVFFAAMSTIAQAPAYRAPRTADGKPNLNGIWQALNTANWDLQGHGGAHGPVASLGAVFTVPPGLGVVEAELQSSQAQINPDYTDRRQETEKIKFYSVSQNICCKET